MATSCPSAHYVRSLLVPQLSARGVEVRQQETVGFDVARRLAGVIGRWQEAAFRQTILLPGLEEATFSEPTSAALEVRALVVMGVRNSLLEDLAATHPSTPLLVNARSPLADEDPPRNHPGSDRLFWEARPRTLCAGRDDPSSDPFADLPRLYPRAWHALSQVANTVERQVTYTLPQGRSAAASHRVNGR